MMFTLDSTNNFNQFIILYPKECDTLFNFCKLLIFKNQISIGES